MSDRAHEWRRRVGAISFLLALAFLATRTFRSESASADIEFRVGAAGADLVRLEAELYRPGEDELVGTYRRNYEEGSGTSAEHWSVRADAGLYRAVVTAVRRPPRSTVRVERGVELLDGARVRIDLEQDLAAR